MGKRECAIVQDLLILYEDGLLQEESRKMINEHIEECETCKKIYEASKRQLVIEEDAKQKEKIEQDGEMAKAMKKFVRRVTLKHVTIIAIVLIVVLVAEGLCRGLTVHGGGIGAIAMSLPAEDVKIKEMYQLRSGDIYIVFQSDKEFSIKFLSTMNVPHDELWTNSDKGFYNVHFEKISKLDRALGTLGFYEVGIVYPAEDYFWNDENVYTRKCKQINYVDNFENDTKVLWEEGMEIEKASLELEKELIAKYIENGYIGKAWDEIGELDLNPESKAEVEEEYQELFDEYLSQDIFAGTYAPMVVHQKFAAQ